MYILGCFICHMQTSYPVSPPINYIIFCSPICIGYTFFCSGGLMQLDMEWYTCTLLKTPWSPPFDYHNRMVWFGCFLFHMLSSAQPGARGRDWQHATIHCHSCKGSIKPSLQHIIISCVRLSPKVHSYFSIYTR